MNYLKEQKMKSNEYSGLLEDPRVWVLALAILLFFFTIIETDQEKNKRKTVEIRPTTTAVEQLSTTAAHSPTSGF